MKKQDFELRGDLRPEYTLPRITRRGPLRPEYNLPAIPASTGVRSNAIVPRVRHRTTPRSLPAAPTATNVAPAAPPTAAPSSAQSVDNDAAVAYVPTLHEQYKPPADQATAQTALLSAEQVVELDADVAAAFPNKAAVNDALRLVMQLAKIPE